jgi:hypothetical protein
VWGFTGGLVASLLRTAGWEQPWDAGDVRDLDGAVAAARGRAVAAARGSVDR